jgi:hypothetical protein
MTALIASLFPRRAVHFRLPTAPLPPIDVATLAAVVAGLAGGALLWHALFSLSLDAGAAITAAAATLALTIWKTRLAG